MKQIKPMKLPHILQRPMGEIKVFLERNPNGAGVTVLRSKCPSVEKLSSKNRTSLFNYMVKTGAFIVEETKPQPESGDLFLFHHPCHTGGKLPAVMENLKTKPADSLSAVICAAVARGCETELERSNKLSVPVKVVPPAKEKAAGRIPSATGAFSVSADAIFKSDTINTDNPNDLRELAKRLLDDADKKEHAQNVQAAAAAAAELAEKNLGIISKHLTNIRRLRVSLSDKVGEVNDICDELEIALIDLTDLKSPK